MVASTLTRRADGGDFFEREGKKRVFFWNEK